MLNICGRLYLVTVIKWYHFSCQFRDIKGLCSIVTLLKIGESCHPKLKGRNS